MIEMTFPHNRIKIDNFLTHLALPHYLARIPCPILNCLEYPRNNVGALLAVALSMWRYFFVVALTQSLVYLHSTGDMGIASIPG
jgi:hypothetical protein